MRLPQPMFILALFASAIVLFASPTLAQTQNPTPPQPNSPQTAPPSVTENQRGRLQRGKAIERELKGGETDVYTIKVKKGQFLHVVVDQLGIDVALALYSQDKKQIARMDSPNGAFGLEQISAIAELGGAYRLEIASDDKSALSGRYRVTVEPARLPTDADRTHISAERIFAEAAQLQGQESSASQRSALQKYDKALKLWRSAGDAYEQILTLNTIGEIYSVLGEKQQALDSFTLALPIERGARDRTDEAETLNDIGLAYDDLGEKQKALDYYGSAITLWRETRDRRGEATTLANLGIVYLTQGEGQKALDCFFQALPLDRTLGDPLREARILNDIGAAYDSLGEEQKALDSYDQALALMRNLANGRGEAMALGNIAVIYRALGEPNKALDNLSQALPLQRAAGDRGSEANTLNGIGLIYRDLGEGQKALDYFFQALPLQRAVGDRLRESVTLSNMGAAYDTLGDKEKALDFYDQALALARAVGYRNGEAATLLAMGKAYDALREQQKALDYLTRALILSRQINNPLLEGHTLYDLMEHWKSRNYDPELAILFGKQAVNKFQQIRANIRGLEREAQQSFLKSKENAYRELADLLIKQGRFPEAQEVLDLLKVEEYSEFSRHRGARDSTDKPATLTRAEKEAKEIGDTLEAEVTALGQQWSSLDRKNSKTPEEQAKYDDLSQKLSAANQQLQNYFKQLYEDFGRGEDANRTVDEAKGQSSSLQNILREPGMKPGTVGLYTLVLDEKSVILVITPSVMVARDVSIRKADLNTKVFAFARAVQNRASEQELLPKAQELYKILFGPIEKDLQGARATTLVWSLDGVLRYLPLAALYDGKQFLVERYANVVLTTTSIGDLKDRPQVAAWRGLAMGISKNYEGLGELPAVPGELDAVITSSALKDSHGPVPGTIMLDDSFTEKNMEGALNQPPPLIHIATHFVFNPGDDEKSYLLLGGKEEGGKGYHLSLADLQDDPRINFSGVELLTLSGCETAMGSKDSDGREVDSLGIVGQRKGAKAVVATLWKVEDESVAVLMETFYRLWTTTPGTTKSDALRQAQLALLRGETKSASAKTDSGDDQSRPYAKPFYWAPFVLIGNWK